jgi:hypothetical protein
LIPTCAHKLKTQEMEGTIFDDEDAPSFLNFLSVASSLDVLELSQNEVSAIKTVHQSLILSRFPAVRSDDVSVCVLSWQPSFGAAVRAARAAASRSALL